MKITPLLKIILLNLILSVQLSGSWTDDPINVGSVSFKDASWDNAYNISLSRHKISDITSNNKAVVLYLFEACFT